MNIIKLNHLLKNQDEIEHYSIENKFVVVSYLFIYIFMQLC